jgi:hypothetical protein
MDLVILAIGAVMILIGGLYYQLYLTHDFMHADGLTYWIQRGVMFYTDGGISIDRLNNLPFNIEIQLPEGPEPFRVLPQQYPLLLPVTIAFTFFVKNASEIMFAKWLWLGIEWATVLLLVGISRKLFCNTFLQFLPLILLYTIPSYFMRLTLHYFGMADAWLGLFWLASVWTCYQWLQTHNRGYWWLAWIFSAGVMMIKVEGIVAVVLLPILLQLRMNMKFRDIFKQMSGLVFWLFPLGWWWFGRQIEVQVYFLHSDLFQDVFKTLLLWAQIIWAYLVELGRISVHGLLWYVYIIAFIWWFKSSGKVWREVYLWLIPVFGLGFILAHFLLIKLANPALIGIPLTMDRYAAAWQPTVVALLLLATQKFFETKRVKKIRE